MNGLSGVKISIIKQWVLTVVDGKVRRYRHLLALQPRKVIFSFLSFHMYNRFKRFQPIINHELDAYHSECYKS